MGSGFKYLDFFRSLSFGGLIGAGIAGILFLKFPYFQTLTSLATFMTYGGLVGAGAHRAVEGVVSFIGPPIGGFVRYYENLLELDFLLWMRKISEEQHKTINAKLTEQRFLGKQLPDRSSFDKL